MCVCVCSEWRGVVRVCVLSGVVWVRVSELCVVS